MNKYILVLFCLCFLACKNDQLPPPDFPDNFEDGVLIWNEGGFGNGNASLTYFQASDLQVFKNVFEVKNAFPLGDIVQEVVYHNQRAYIIVNNSGRIEVADALSLSHLGTINTVSPRSFLAISDTEALVSNFTLDANGTTLDKIDLESLSITESITSGWIESMVFVEGKVIAGQMHSNNLLIIDPNTMQIDTLPVAKSPNSLQVDNNNKVWVLSSGGIDNAENAALYQVNPQSQEIEQSFIFPDINASPHNLLYNPPRDEFFYLLNDQIYRMDLLAETLPSSPENSARYYSLGLAVNQQELFAFDAGDFQSLGTAYRYHINLDNLLLRDSFKTGVAPGGAISWKPE